MTRYAFRPPPGTTGSSYGIFTDSGATVPAAITPDSDSGVPLSSHVLVAGDRLGTLHSFRGPDTVQTLYMRRLDAGVTPTGSITTLTGSDPSTFYGTGWVPSAGGGGGASGALLIVYAAGVYALRSTVTSSSTTPVEWRGPVAPSQAAGYMLTIDTWTNTGSVA